MPALSHRLTRLVGAFLAVTGTAAILVATLTPAPGQAAAAASTPLLCLVCGEGGGTDVFLNLLLFTPMAVGLRLLDWPWRRVVAASALLSLSVESLQLALVPGRDSSLSDLVTNTTGAAIAAALAPHLPRALLPNPAPAWRLLLGAAAFQLAVLTLSAVAFLPSVQPGPLRSDCTSYSTALGTWDGTLRTVAMEGADLPCDEELGAHGASIRAALVGGHASLRAEGVAGAATRGRAMVHAIRAGAEPVLALAQDGNSAVFNVPTVSRRLRLSAVTLQLPEAFPREVGASFDLRAGREGNRLWILAIHSGHRRSAEVTLRPSLGWINLLWWRLQPGARLRTLAAIWLGALMLPAGYWAGFVKPPLRGAAVVAAALVAGVGVVPLVAGYAPADGWEWLGGSLGAILGWALSRFAAYLQSRCGSPSISAYSSS